MALSYKHVAHKEMTMRLDDDRARLENIRKGIVTVQSDFLVL